MALVPRAKFLLPERALSWHPGHMRAFLQQMVYRLTDIDFVIEARDSRLPLTSINPNLEQLLDLAWGRGWKEKQMEKGYVGRQRKKTIVYTKKDLAISKYEEPLRKAFKQHTGDDVYFTSIHDVQSIKTIIAQTVKHAKKHQDVIFNMNVLVLGMPNVGKSTLLNHLRHKGMGRGKAFRSSATAGHTTKLEGIVKINEDPNVYVLDAPGVMPTNLGTGEEASERGVKLALTSGMKEGLLDPEIMADYLLFLLNKRTYDESLKDPAYREEAPDYIQLLKMSKFLPSPTDSIEEFLQAYGHQNRMYYANSVPKKVDEVRTARKFIEAFRQGELGKWMLDDLENPVFDDPNDNGVLRIEAPFDPNSPPWAPAEIPKYNAIVKAVSLEEKVSETVRQHLIDVHRLGDNTLAEYLTSRTVEQKRLKNKEKNVERKKRQVLLPGNLHN